MNIGNLVKIGYKDFEVNLIDRALVDGDKVLYGRIEHDFATITISKIYSEDQQKCTFLHECIHGIDELFEIGLEEEQVRKLSKGIYQFIKDNPHLFVKEGE